MKKITVQATKRFLPPAALFLAVFLIAAGLFRLCWRYDNKYTAGGPQPVIGVMEVSGDSLERWPVTWLVRDWEIFRGVLLTPEDFRTGINMPDEYTFIGQYGGFEGSTANGVQRGPHGSATYRLRLALPRDERSYTLELPEIYTAYRLYLNGNLYMEMAVPDPEGYTPRTGATSVTVRAADRLEIIVAVSDYRHFYSGIVYPPAFGEAQAVENVLNRRTALWTAVCAVALCVGLLYLLLGVFSGRRGESDGDRALPFLYGALCLAFVLSACHPVVKTLWHGGMWFYWVENLAYCMMFLLVGRIMDRVCGVDRRLTGLFTAFALFTCTWALLVPHLMGDSLTVMTLYSRLIGLYTKVCALYLTAGAVWGIVRGTLHSRLLLAGMAVFDAALVMDRLLPLHEPILTGWFTQLAGGFLVLVIGVAMTADVAAQFRLRQAVQEQARRVSRMLEVQQANYPVILEKAEEVRIARHDLRHHITAIRGLVEGEDLQGLREYVDGLRESSASLAETTYCGHHVTDVLLRMYAGLAAEGETDFRAQIDMPEQLAVSNNDLCVILSNILENALEASAALPERERRVTVRIGSHLNRLSILVENRFDGRLRVEGGRFFSHKKKGRKGVGIASVRKLAVKYGGSADFYPGGQDLFYSEVTLPLGKEGG